MKRSLLPKAFLGNVIVNLSLAKHRLTAKYLFSVHMRRLKTKKDTFRTGAERSQKMFSDAMTEYSTIPPEDHALWDAKAREYILAQPGILDQILKIMRKNPTSSYDIGIHNNVRADFRRTNTGIERFDGEHIAPPS